MRGRRLRRFLTGLVVALVAAVVLVLWPWPQADRVTLENFALLEEGMPRAEVEALLGPPGDYRTGDTDLALSGPTGFGQPAVGRVATREGDVARIRVNFDPSGRVSCAVYQAMRRSDNPVRNALLRAFRLWTHWFPVQPPPLPPRLPRAPQTLPVA